MAFAARGPRTPYNTRLIDGVSASVSDEVAEIRGMAVVLKERALRIESTLNTDVKENGIEGIALKANMKMFPNLCFDLQLIWVIILRSAAWSRQA
jgi:hypothetical protein